ncbi:replication initiator protein A [Verminephrobacter eiseniae]|uniref:replication initiator protein A n=1 Tax=Verminephrobacter eiseniae TaxID=364317 RepID=UPI002238BF60|nr:replication initiator protein A [Verminephrobacter eiseniae]
MQCKLAGSNASSSEAGMASVWDYDIVLMAISHLTDAMNRYREGRGEKPSRIFWPHVSEILKFCRRSDGGRQYEEIEGALKRLGTTFVEMVTQAKGKRALRTAKGVGLINATRRFPMPTMAGLRAFLSRCRSGSITRWSR